VPKSVPKKPAAPPERRSHADLWISLALFVITIAIYAPVRTFDFVNFDDPEYVSNNPHVRGGLTVDGLKWAFTSGDAANWFPLTRLSHLLDVQIFGVQSGWHHLTNVLIHALAALLLFAFLHRATRSRWPSAFVAFVFALHPLHVESVAWVAERKDVLSAFFWFLALWAYVRYTESPSTGRYLLVAGAFCCGLMSKPMIVTLPFVLLLLDVWPLRRIELRPWDSGPLLNSAASRAGMPLWEKVPLFVLSGTVALITFFVQGSSGAVEGLRAFPFGLRVENALDSYLVYIGKMLWPSGLAVFYPYPADIPAWQVLLAAFTIVSISILVWRAFRNRPYLAVGWLWFLGTLLPVIGLVQVGAQARADRYLYVPMVGLLIMLAWGVADVARMFSKTAVIAVAGVACAGCAVITSLQIQHWKNSETLFQHALDVTSGNYLAHHNLGTQLLELPGRLPEAVTHLEASIEMNPNSPGAHTDLGNALSRIPSRWGEAVEQYQAALHLAPDSAIAHNNLGNTLSKIPGRLPQAIPEYQAALRIQPDYAEAHNNLGMALAQIPGRLPEAIAEYQAALRMQPDYAMAHSNLGSALAELPGRTAEAIAEDQAALQLAPESAEAHYNLGVLFSKIGRTAEAIVQLEAALKIEPDYAEAHNNLGVTLSALPDRLSDAIANFEEALRLSPDYADAHYNLGVALSNLPGRMPEAIAHLEAALRLKPDPELRRTVDQLRRTQR
jgi:protein O-mannosyl-transferase